MFNISSVCVYIICVSCTFRQNEQEEGRQEGQGWT